MQSVGRAVPQTAQKQPRDHRAAHPTAGRCGAPAPHHRLPDQPVNAHRGKSDTTDTTARITVVTVLLTITTGPCRRLLARSQAMTSPLRPSDTDGEAGQSPIDQPRAERLHREHPCTAQRTIKGLHRCDVTRSVYCLRAERAKFPRSAQPWTRSFCPLHSRDHCFTGSRHGRDSSGPAGDAPADALRAGRLRELPVPLTGCVSPRECHCLLQQLPEHRLDSGPVPRRRRHRRSPRTSTTSEQQVPHASHRAMRILGIPAHAKNDPDPRVAPARGATKDCRARHPAAPRPGGWCATERSASRVVLARVSSHQHRHHLPVLC